MTDPSNVPEPVDPRETEIARDTVTVRRAPRYSRFIMLGGLVGVVVALILTVAFPENDEFDKGQIFGFLLLACATVGVALGAVIALVIDRATARRAASVTVEHETIHPPADE